jgi:hypothetical protein
MDRLNSSFHVTFADVCNGKWKQTIEPLLPEDQLNTMTSEELLSFNKKMWEPILDPERRLVAMAYELMDLNRRVVYDPRWTMIFALHKVFATAELMEYLKKNHVLDGCTYADLETDKIVGNLRALINTRKKELEPFQQKDYNNVWDFLSATSTLKNDFRIDFPRVYFTEKARGVLGNIVGFAIENSYFLHFADILELTERMRNVYSALQMAVNAAEPYRGIFEKKEWPTSGAKGEQEKLSTDQDKKFKRLIGKKRNPRKMRRQRNDPSKNESENESEGESNDDDDDDKFETPGEIEDDTQAKIVAPSNAEATVRANWSDIQLKKAAKKYVHVKLLTGKIDSIGLYADLEVLQKFENMFMTENEALTYNIVRNILLTRTENLTLEMFKSNLKLQKQLSKLKKQFSGKITIETHIGAPVDPIFTRNAPFEVGDSVITKIPQNELELYSRYFIDWYRSKKQLLVLEDTAKWTEQLEWDHRTQVYRAIDFAEWTIEREFFAQKLQLDFSTFTLRAEVNKTLKTSQRVLLKCPMYNFTEAGDVLSAAINVKPGEVRDSTIYSGFTTNQIPHRYRNASFFKTRQVDLIADSSTEIGFLSVQLYNWMKSQLVAFDIAQLVDDIENLRKRLQYAETVYERRALRTRMPYGPEPKDIVNMRKEIDSKVEQLEKLNSNATYPVMQDWLQENEFVTPPSSAESSRASSPIPTTPPPPPIPPPASSTSPRTVTPPAKTPTPPPADPADPGAGAGGNDNGNPPQLPPVITPQKPRRGRGGRRARSEFNDDEFTWDDEASDFSDEVDQITGATMNSTAPNVLEEPSKPFSDDLFTSVPFVSASTTFDDGAEKQRLQSELDAIFDDDTVDTQPRRNSATDAKEVSTNVAVPTNEALTAWDDDFLNWS